MNIEPAVSSQVAPAADSASRFWVLGIDPGSKGALAALRSDISDIRIFKMPMLEKTVDTAAVREFLCSLRAESDIRHAVIEKSQVMPSQGAVSGFVYGRNYGCLVTSLEFMGIPFVEVSPAKWKAAVIGASCKVTGSDAQARAAQKRAIKELAIVTARRMFPSAGPFRKTEDGLAEAALLAEAARRLVLHGSMANHRASA